MSDRSASRVFSMVFRHLSDRERIIFTCFNNQPVYSGFFVILA